MVKLGYMTNAFAPLVGTGGGVTSMKEVGYLTMGPEDELIRRVSETRRISMYIRLRKTLGLT